MPASSRSEQSLLRDKIADDLREKIRAGVYPPGSRLPSQDVAAEEYGVAKDTFRSALDVLEAEGLVLRQSTRGAFVAVKPPEDVRPGLAAVSERLSALAKRVEERDELRPEVDELRRQFAQLENNVIDLYSRFGFDYPHGGEHDSEEKPSRRRRASG